MERPTTFDWSKYRKNARGNQPKPFVTDVPTVCEQIVKIWRKKLEGRDEPIYDKDGDLREDCQLATFVT